MAPSPTAGGTDPPKDLPKDPQVAESDLCAIAVPKNKDESSVSEAPEKEPVCTNSESVLPSSKPCEPVSDTVDSSNETPLDLSQSLQSPDLTSKTFKKDIPESIAHNEVNSTTPVTTDPTASSDSIDSSETPTPIVVNGEDKLPLLKGPRLEASVDADLSTTGDIIKLATETQIDLNKLASPTETLNTTSTSESESHTKDLKTDSISPVPKEKSSELSSSRFNSPVSSNTQPPSPTPSDPVKTSSPKPSTARVSSPRPSKCTSPRPTKAASPRPTKSVSPKPSTATTTRKEHVSSSKSTNPKPNVSPKALAVKGISAINPRVSKTASTRAKSPGATKPTVNKIAKKSGQSKPTPTKSTSKLSSVSPKSLQKKILASSKMTKSGKKSPLKKLSEGAKKALTKNGPRQLSKIKEVAKTPLKKALAKDAYKPAKAERRRSSSPGNSSLQKKDATNKLEGKKIGGRKRKSESPHPDSSGDTVKDKIAKISKKELSVSQGKEIKEKSKKILEDVKKKKSLADATVKRKVNVKKQPSKEVLGNSDNNPKEVDKKSIGKETKIEVITSRFTPLSVPKKKKVPTATLR